MSLKSKKESVMRYLKENRRNLEEKISRLDQLEKEISEMGKAFKIDEILEKEHLRINGGDLSVNCIPAIMDTLTESELKNLDQSLLSSFRNKIYELSSIVSSNIKSPAREEMHLFADIFHWISCAAYESQKGKPAYRQNRGREKALIRQRYPGIEQEV